MEALYGVIGVFGTILGMLLGFFGFQRNRDKDVKQDASQTAVIETKLDNIYKGVDTIRIDMKAGELRTTELSEKLVRVDESTKQAHRRIDELSKARGDVS